MSVADRAAQVLRAATPLRVTLTGLALVVVGVFGRWSEFRGVTLNGFEGPNNGWLVVLFGLVAAGVAIPAHRGSARSTVALGIAGVMMFWTVLVAQGPAGASAGWGRWVAGVGSAAIVAAAGVAWSSRRIGSTRERGESTEAPDAGVAGNELEHHTSATDPAPSGTAADTEVSRSGDSEPGDGRAGWVRHVGTAGLVLFVVAALLLRQSIAVTESTSWPPPPDAITAPGAQEATEDFVRGSNGTRDVGLDYAWSTAATVDPYPDGDAFFPAIIDDLRAAESSIHVLMFGWTSDDIGLEIADVLAERLADGVEVRVIVDGFGSEVSGRSASMFEGLADQGAEIVVQDMLPLDRDGTIGDRSIDLSHDEFGRADHRKLYVVDGVIAWTGGAGIEEHFRNGRFHDVMVRVTGDVVRQAQALILTSFGAHGADVPDDLSPYFPAPPDAGDIPTALLQVTPGGFASATQQAREMIDAAEERVDVMNPYILDVDMVRRMINASERGVEVRIVASERSNNKTLDAGWRHHHDALVSAGVEIWDYPAVVHAKITVADDLVHFGTLNYDAWALYRNHEIAMVAESAELADRFRSEIFDADIAQSQPATSRSGADAVWNWVVSRVAYFL